MSYAVHVEAFEGPLDLLLQLVEKNELEITNISLLQVTEPFLKHLEEHRGRIATEELADFLVVAAKLVYLKSKALLPSFLDPTLEEGPDLETQLRMYKAFVDAARKLGEMAKKGQRSFGRTKRPTLDRLVGFVPPPGVTAASMRELFSQILKRLEPILALPQVAIERVVSIEEKIADLSLRVRKAVSTSFHRYLAESKDRGEMVVSFLALLELIKQRIVKIKQEDLFEEIHLEAV